MIHSGIFDENVCTAFFYFVRFGQLAAVAWCAKFGDIMVWCNKSYQIIKQKYVLQLNKHESDQTFKKL